MIDAHGAVLATERDDRGSLAMADGGFAADIATFRARFGDLPVLCAGMVGSNRGWTSVPYLSCSIDLPALAQALHWIEPGHAAIVPSVSTAPGSCGDVMRGEKVQLLSAPGDALLCQPGTHCKWARMARGGPADFRTTLTGELFALPRRDSLLAETIGGDVIADPAFDEGVRNAAVGQRASPRWSDVMPCRCWSARARC